MAATHTQDADYWSYAGSIPSPPLSPISIPSGVSTPASFASENTAPFFSNVSTPYTELSESQTLPATDPTPAEQYVLVVGGLGYIGSHTTWELLKAGHNVVIVDNLSNSYKDVLERIQLLVKDYYKGCSNVPHIDFFEADYRKKPAMKAILERYDSLYTLKSTITSVIHFAAYKAVEESIHQPLKYYSNNVAGLIDFCDLLDRFEIKTLVFSSSATVYGELANQGGQLQEELTSHTTTRWTDAAGRPHTTLSGCTGLTNPYGRTKWMSEAILSDVAASDPSWKIYALRYFNPIGCDASGLLGEDPRGTPNNLMPLVIRAMEGQMPELAIFGADWDTRDGTAVRDFIHVSDLARGHVAAIAAGGSAKATPGFHAINLGTGTGSSVREVVDTMQAVSGREIKTGDAPRREGDVGVCVADPGKAERVLGWRPLKTLEDSCRDICRYLDAHA
ncbi:UDP-glucose 4-epimerase [Ascochyta rabiei]|uniref:UDP-glucose 4-epimerase n=1 Tax=Didymella rabiei TaxID=5454 RepID=UPI001901D1F1|nr:UDP-glucose 4-epimerase [Ascochyta rabiei]UPX14196.1 UDP-glucose 4-epimerase [Ascochyta rabiei]